MEIKYTRNFLNKLEDIFAESDYILRYEKGNFKAGYCLLKDTKIAIVSKYYTTEGKINCLLDILRNLNLTVESLSDKNKKIYLEISQNELKL